MHLLEQYYEWFLFGRSPSNIGTYVGCPTWYFSWLSSVPPSRCCDDTSKGHKCLLLLRCLFIAHLQDYQIRFYSSKLMFHVTVSFLGYSLTFLSAIPRRLVKNLVMRGHGNVFSRDSHNKWAMSLLQRNLASLTVIYLLLGNGHTGIRPSSIHQTLKLRPTRMVVHGLMPYYSFDN